MNGAVYAVDSGYNASVLYQFPPQSPDQFMINGIVYDPAGFLLVADTVGGDLYRVPIGEPSATMKVALAEPVKGADGIVWQDPQRLAVVSNSENRVVILTSSDGWASAAVAGVGPLDEAQGQATTAAVAAGVLYAVHPHFADQDRPSITRVTVR